jgi:hypothetical protein
MLLKKVPDAKKIERLMKPENLLVLRQTYGYSREETNQALAEGMLPGELLLELLNHEPDIERLLAQLPVPDERINATVPPSQSVTSSQHIDPSTSETIPLWLAKHRFKAHVSHKGYSGFAEVCLFLAVITAILTVIILPMIGSQFYTDALPISLSPQILTIIGIISGIVVAALTYPTFRFYREVGLVVVVLNLGVLWSMLLLTRDQEWMWSGQLQLAAIVGALPACALAYYLFRRNR